MTTNRKIHTLQHLTIAEMGKLNIFILFQVAVLSTVSTHRYLVASLQVLGGVATAEISLTRVASGWLNCCSWSVNLLREETGLGGSCGGPDKRGMFSFRWVMIITPNQISFKLLSDKREFIAPKFLPSSLLRINRFGKRFFYKLGCSPCHLRQTCNIIVTRLAFLFAWKYNWMLYVKGRVCDLFIFLLNGHSVCEQVTWPRHIHATGVEGCLFHIEIIWSKTIFSSSSS